MAYLLACLFVGWVVYDTFRYRELVDAILDMDRRIDELEVWRGVVERVPVNPQWSAMVNEVCEAQGDET